MIPTIDERLNVGAAALNRDLLERHGVRVISLFGRRGCGKTALLRSTLARLAGELRIGVIIANLNPYDDAKRLASLCTAVQPIETTELTAELVREALLKMDLNSIDLLLIEHPAMAWKQHRDDVGQSANVSILDASHDGPVEAEFYDRRIQHCDALLLNKVDLTGRTPARLRELLEAVRSHNPFVHLIETSVANGIGLRDWCDWIRRHVQPHADKVKISSLLGGSAYFVG